MIQAAAGPVGPVDIDPAVLSPTLAGGALHIQRDGDSQEVLFAILFDAVAPITWPPEREMGTEAVTAQRLAGPIQFLVKLLALWNLERGDAAALLGFRVTESEYVAAVLDGLRPLSGRDTQDRIAHLFRIHETLASLFRDVEVENEWLREKHALLDGQSPMSILLRGSMEGLLWVKEYVEITGRR